MHLHASMQHALVVVTLKVWPHAHACECHDALVQSCSCMRLLSPCAFQCVSSTGLQIAILCPLQTLPTGGLTSTLLHAADDLEGPWIPPTE